MCAATLRFDPPPAAVPPAATPRRWSDGAAEIGYDSDRGTPALRHLFQSDPCRVLFPTPAAGGPPEAVIVTTSGGLVGGDRIRIGLSAGPGASACITSQAAEKVYRSLGAVSEVDIAVNVAPDGMLEWMPQETILFDGARLRRTTSIALAPGAGALAGEIIVFGRLARGERFRRGLLHDSWRIRRDGRLVWADALHLEDDIAATLARGPAFDGATAAATLVLARDGAARHLEAARGLLTEHTAGCTAGATSLGDVLLVRFLGRDAQALRQSYAAFWGAFRSEAAGLPRRIPRVWNV